ncbi:MAG: YqgE/AlgH family protein [Thiotrichales bacterium]|nr:YqgE/AlgH family protein [Thiotrichales bacterium]
MKQMHSLEHHFLVAMPSLDQSWFAKSVIYIVEDNAHGSMGLAINLSHAQLDVRSLLEHFDYPYNERNPHLDQPIVNGGPVETERGFILHRPLGNWKSSLSLKDGLAMTVSDDFLQGIGQDEAPEDFLICLGFAGWEPGQLAQELHENSWLTIPYNPTLLFETPIEQRWELALATLGIAPEFLSSEAGHA